MASIGISEFTFGYAFLYEQTRANWRTLRAAPILPSLQQEQHAGWDAHLPVLGVDFYYQFKLSDHLSRANATFIAEGVYSSPYYRVALHRRNLNRQHQRLRQHSATYRHTYYVAPEFDTIDDFNAAFLSSQITARSRIIPLTDCDDINDGAQHYITFQPGSREWKQHSEEKTHDISYSGRDLEKLYLGTRQEWRATDKKFAEELFDKTAAVVRSVVQREEKREPALSLLNFNPRQAERSEILFRTSQILSVTLGVTLVIVGARNQ